MQNCIRFISDKFSIGILYIHLFNRHEMFLIFFFLNLTYFNRSKKIVLVPGPETADGLSIDFKGEQIY